MLNNMRLLLTVAAVGMLVTLTQGGVIVFNTDTGIVDSYSGGVIRTGDGTWTSSLDSANQIYTWAFTGSVTIPSGTTLQFVGSNLASFQAGEFIFGTEGGEAITIDASSYNDDGSGKFVRGAGGGLGGEGGLGAGPNPNLRLNNGGRGGTYGEGGTILTPNMAGYDGYDGGINWTGGAPGIAGSAGYAGGVGAGCIGQAAEGGAGGAGASETGGYGQNPGEGGDGGRPDHAGEAGGNGGTGRTGWTGGKGGTGANGTNQPANALDLSAGGGGGGGGGGGSGSQGTGGSGGGGGGGGGSYILTGGCRGGMGGVGGEGGAGGIGADGRIGGAGGGAVEFVALGRMTANVTINAQAKGENGSHGSGGSEGSLGKAGEAGEAGGSAWGAMSGGKGGNGGRGGTGGTGGTSGAGAGGTVRLVATAMSGDVVGEMTGGKINYVYTNSGRLVMACDVAGGMNATMATDHSGTIVNGTGADVGLYRRSPQLNADAPRLLGLAEGYDTTGLLAAKAADLGLEGVSSCPVIACRDVTHLGDDYIGYNMVMLAGGTRKIDYVTFSADPDSKGNLYTGFVGERERVIEFQSGDVYGFLIPEDGVTMGLTYKIARTTMKCTVSLKDEETIDLKADRFIYDSVLVKGKFDLYNAPAITQELTIEDIDVGTTLKVDILDAEGGCDFLDVTGEAILDGTLELQFKDFTPIIGTEYCFLEAGSFSGQFDELVVQGIDPDMVDYDMAGGTLTIVPEPATWILFCTLLLILALPSRIWGCDSRP